MEEMLFFQEGNQHFKNCYIFILLCYLLLFCLFHWFFYCKCLHIINLSINILAHTFYLICIKETLIKSIQMRYLYETLKALTERLFNPTPTRPATSPPIISYFVLHTFFLYMIHLKLFICYSIICGICNTTNNI